MAIAAVRDLDDTGLHPLQQELGLRRSEFVPRVDGWCSHNEIDFRFPFAGVPSRGGGIEQCSVSQPQCHDEMHSYSLSTQALLRMLLLLLLPSHAMS